MPEFMPSELWSQVYGIDRIIPVEQRGDSDCFPACVRSLILTIYGDEKLTYEDLCQKLGTTKDGVEVTQTTVEILKELGLSAAEYDSAKMADIASVLKNGFLAIVEYQAPNSDYHPAILKAGNRKRVGQSRKHGHYSIIYKLTEDYNRDVWVWIMDPLVNKKDGNKTGWGAGIRVMAAGFFQKRWENVHSPGGWMLAVHLNRN